MNDYNIYGNTTANDNDGRSPEQYTATHPVNPVTPGVVSNNASDNIVSTEAGADNSSSSASDISEYAGQNNTAQNDTAQLPLRNDYNRYSGQGYTNYPADNRNCPTGNQSYTAGSQNCPTGNQGYTAGNPNYQAGSQGYTAGSQNDYGQGLQYNQGFVQQPNTADYGQPAKKKGRTGRFFKLAGAAVAFGVLAGVVFIGTNHIYKITYSTSDSQLKQEQPTDTSDPGEQPNFGAVTENNNRLDYTDIMMNVDVSSTDVSAIVEASEPALVSIKGTFNTQTIFGVTQTPGSGTGFIIQKNDDELLIATNNHVVMDAVSITVTFCDDTSVSGIVKGTDSLADLAVLSIKLSDLTPDTLESITVAKLGSSDDMKVGQMVIAIGNALGYGQSTTVGYLSAKERNVTIENKPMTLIQTDAAINPGNSGGALLNMKGEVIGINSAKFASAQIEGMGLAIPISRATAILDDLMSREILDDSEKGYLGIYMEAVDEADSVFYNWPIGIRVTNLVEGCAADLAGIKPGDIITKINGSTVTTINQLRDAVTSFRCGTVIKVTLQRMIKGEFNEKVFDVTLGQNPKYATSPEKDNINNY